MAKEILVRYPSIVNAPDNEGRTPLHYAAICRDGGLMYDLLVDYGADENKLDNVRKIPLITVKVLRFKVFTVSGLIMTLPKHDHYFHCFNLFYFTKSNKK